MGTPTDGERTEQVVARRWGLLAVMIGAVAAIAVVGPIALIAWSDRGSASFGDQETIGRNRIGAATVDLAVGDRTVPLRAVGLAPGDLVTGEIEFVNAGTVALRYAVTVATTADDGLGAWLTWRFRPVAGGDSCPSTAQWRTEFAGTPGAASAAGAASSVGNVAANGTAVMGDVAPGADAGDRVLEVAASDRLCVAVAVAIDAPNAVQNSSTEVRITAHGEQLTGADSGADPDADRNSDQNSDRNTGPSTTIGGTAP